MKRRAKSVFLPTLLIVALLITGCGGGGEQKGEEQTGPLPKGDKATAAEAYRACKSEIEKMEAAGGKLSMITGRMVDLEGRSETWDFMILGPQAGTSGLLENHVGWEKGSIKTWDYGEQDTMGYENSPSYAYLFNPIGGSWVDSTPIVKAYAQKYPPGELSLGAMDLRLRYYKDPEAGVDGMVWSAVWELEQRGMPSCLFDASSGSFLLEISP